MSEELQAKIDEMSKQLETTKKEAETQIKELQSHIKTLNEENKNKRLSEKELKDMLAQTLGITDKPTDSEILKAEIANKFKTLETSLNEALEKQKQAEQKAIKIEKISSAKDIIAKFKPQNADDVLAFVNINSENLETEIKAIKEAKPYLFKSESYGGGGNPSNNAKFVQNPWKKETFNRTKQAEIMDADTAKALKMKQEAGIQE